MTKTFLVMMAEIRVALRRKLYVFFAFGMPLILGFVALGLLMTNRSAVQDLRSAVAPTSAPVEDRGALPQGYVDPGNLVRTLPGDLPAAGRLVRLSDELTARQVLDRAEIAGYFVIPPDYVESGALTYVVRQYNPLGAKVDDSLIEHVLAFNLLGGDPGDASRVAAPLDVRIRRLAASGAQKAEDSWIAELLPTLLILLLYLAILMPAGSLVNAFTDEKKNRAMEMLLTSISTRQMMTGKIIALGLLGLAQVVLWVGVLGAVIRFGGAPLAIPPGFALPAHLIAWTVVCFLGGYAIYAALLAGVGAVAPDLKDTRSTNMVVMAPLILSYIFLMVVTERPDSSLALLLSLFPLTSPIALIGRMTAAVVPFWQAALAAALQLLAAIFIIRMVARLIRAQYLLSGQPVSPQGYLRALLGRSPVVS